MALLVGLMKRLVLRRKARPMLSGLTPGGGSSRAPAIQTVVLERCQKR